MGREHTDFVLVIESKRRTKGRPCTPISEKSAIATKIAIWLGLRRHFELAAQGRLKGEKTLIALLGVNRTMLRSIWKEFHFVGLQEAIEVSRDALREGRQTPRMLEYARRFVAWDDTRRQPPETG